MFSGDIEKKLWRWISKAIAIALLLSGVSVIAAPSAHAAVPPDGFYKCSSGIKDAGTPRYTITGGVVSSGGSCVGAVVLPDGVTSIGSSAFSSNTLMTSINIPSTVTSIAFRGFAWTERLTTINIPNSVTSIGDQAFYSATALNAITISSNVAAVAVNVFGATNAMSTYTYCGSLVLPSIDFSGKTNLCVTAPGAPTIGTATATGATTATVSFTAPSSNGGSTILSYKATSSPGSITTTLTQAGSGTFSVTGLSASTSYTFTVLAHNSIGDSSSSAASNSITTQSGAVTLSAPTATTSFINTDSFIVSFSMPTGATSVTLRIYQSDGITLFSDPVTNFVSGNAVTGLSQGRSYKFSLTAIGNGTSYLTSSIGGLISVTVPTPPMPSYFKMVSAPKISQNTEFVICKSATLIFMPWSTVPDQTKIRTQITSIRSGDLVLAQSDSLASTVKFSKSLFKPGLTVSCSQYASQENAVAEVSSFDSTEVVILKIEDKEARALVQSAYKSAKAALAALRKITLSNLLGKKSIASKAGGFTSQALQDARDEYAVALSIFETNYGKQRQLLLTQKTAALGAVSEHIEGDEEVAGICLVID